MGRWVWRPFKSESSEESAVPEEPKEDPKPKSVDELWLDGPPPGTSGVEAVDGGLNHLITNQEP